MEHMPSDAKTSNLDFICIKINHDSNHTIRSSFMPLLVHSVASTSLQELLAQVLGGLGRRALRGHICLGQSTVNHKVGGIDEATFVASQEDDGVSLFDGFTEATGGEVDFAAESLLFIISEPILQQGGAAIVREAAIVLAGLHLLQRRRAQGVEAETCSS